MRLRRVAASLALVAGGLVPQPARADPAPPAPRPRAETPVFSLRRVPDLLAHTVADTHLGADLDAILSDPVLGGARDHSCLVVGDPGGAATHYARQPSQALIPASTLKLLVTEAALTQLGPNSHFTTDVRAASPPADGGVGDLYLVGGGDPLLATADFAVDGGYQGQPRLATSMEALADKVVAAGVRRVGRVLGDDSRYDAVRLVPSWKPSYAAEFEITPLSALVVNKGLVTTKPPTAAASPAAHAAGVLADLLRARGVTVGSTGAATAPASAPVVTSIDSPPLSDVVGEILQQSDNMGAEMLLKELSARPGVPGSTAAGLKLEVAQLQKVVGVGPDDFSAVDGSGLDRSDHVSCDVLQRLLDRTGQGSDLGKALPQAGRNGTLFHRFLATPASGKVQAKTGSLDGVAGLAGFATTRDGGDLTFTLLANDLPRESVGTALQDKVVNVLAGYPRAPDVADLSPKAPASPAG